MRYLSSSIISPLLVIASIMMSSCANIPTKNVEAINLGSVLALGKLIETNPNTAAHEIDLFVRLYVCMKCLFMKMIASLKLTEYVKTNTM